MSKLLHAVVRKRGYNFSIRQGVAHMAALREDRVVDHPADWTALRSLGGSHFARATILIPVVGYLIIFNDKAAEYFTIYFDSCKNLGCGPSWRLYILYFGLCFIAIGTIIFQRKCPSTIRRYENSREFFRVDHAFYAHHTNLSWMLDDVETMQGKRYQDSLKLDEIVDIKGVVGSNEIHTLSGLMGRYYNLKNKSNYNHRIIVLSLFLLGVILISIPTIFTFFEIIISFFNRFVFRA